MNGTKETSEDVDTTRLPSTSAAPPPPPPPLPPPPPRPDGSFPQPFGRYELLRPLGQGGMGAVYLAFDTLLQRQVALKTPHPSLLRDPALRALFVREARAAARLSHPNLCPVLDYGHHGEVVYFTMPYYAGGSLAVDVARSPAEVAGLVLTIARAMAVAHRLNVLHRDLKAANLLLDADGRLIIADFGLALRLDTTDAADADRFAGTLKSMAPEQFGGSATPQSDIYALGVLFYRLLTGRPPLDAADVWSLEHLVRNVAPEPPSRSRPEVDAQLDAICLRALAKAPADRWPTMDAFADALAAYLATAPDVPPPPIRVPRSAVRFVFVGPGSQVTKPAGGTDRLFLDVGNDLGPGVIDHHQLVAGAGSTAGLVLSYPHYVAAAVRPDRQADQPFDLVLHRGPDLDAVAAAALVLHYLETGAFPAGAAALGRYVDAVDAGQPSLSAARPHTLYAAYYALINRLQTEAPGDHVAWVAGGVRLVDYVLSEMAARGVAVPDVDAFACPGLFAAGERRDAVLRDWERYLRKLAAPETKARQVVLRLPGQLGGWVDVPALFVRDVQNADDPERVFYFKEWARSDGDRAVDGRGFAALCVWHSAGRSQRPHAIVSLRPDCGATLHGVGAALDAEESKKRQERHNGVDDRVVDPATRLPKTPRRGYANADPWYDGRAHAHTIVDAPREGTVLNADEVEAVLLRWARP